MVEPGRHSTPAASYDAPHVAANQRLLGLVERALERAVTEQVRPPMGMYAHPSTAENAAFDRAVNEISSHARRLDLRAEELLLAMKQAWSHLAPVRARHLGDRDGDVLAQLVSHAITVYFASRDVRVDE